MCKRKFYKIRAEIILDYRILELQQKLTYVKNVWIKIGNTEKKKYSVLIRVSQSL
jgi:hypothetical protein